MSPLLKIVQGSSRHLQGVLLRRAREERLITPVYCLLVESIFGTIGAFLSLSIAGFILAGLIFYRHPGWVTFGLGGLLVLITVSRLMMLTRYLRFRRQGNLIRLRDALQWELVYSVLSIPLMISIGAEACYAAATTDDRLMTIFSTAIIMAIGAIIASRNGGRPLIAKFQNAALCLPYATTLMLSGCMELQVAGVMTVLYYVGILSATKTTYHTLRKALVNGKKAEVLSTKASEQAKLLSAVLDNMTTGLMMYNQEHRLLVSNAKAYALFGEAKLKALLGGCFEDVADHVLTTFGSTPDQVDELTTCCRRDPLDAGEFRFGLTDRLRERSFAVCFKRIEVGGGYLISFDDVTERKRKDEEIEWLAHRDVLTGLDNRYSLVEALKRAGTGSQNETTALYIDLDGFKSINDAEGHVFGDRLLAAVGERLRAVTRCEDTVSRMGGDEFFILFAADMDTAEAERISQDVIECIQPPIWVEGKQVSITASGGLARIATPFDPEALIRRADLALYEAKTRGRDRRILFEEAMEEKAKLALLLQADLKQAIANDELDLEYQPIVDVDCGRTICCEALMRWDHPYRGRVAPLVFIPIAEKTSLICELGAWALMRACRDAMSWPDPGVKVAVNISARHFKNERGSVTDAIEDALRVTGLDPRRLQVEITESLLASDMERMRDELEVIHARGVAIVLDDFGTGYSSLNYIHKLPVDKIKLDRSFISAVAKDPKTIVFIASIVQMAQALRKELVIEGVETAEELALVRSINARIIQGFYISKPLRRGQIVQYITESNCDGLYEDEKASRSKASKQESASGPRRVARRSGSKQQAPSNGKRKVLTESIKLV